LREIAKAQEVADLGPRGQGLFLKELGIEQRLSQLKQGKSREICAQLQADFERLTHFLQMGVLFQVYTAYHPGNLKPCGF
jgi:SAM-dependent MidA family methyltransferase